MPQRNKSKTALPVLGPQDAFGANAQLRELYGAYRDVTGTLKTQRTQIRSGFNTQRAALQRARQLGLEEAENTAIERGLLGGSNDLERRVAVRADIGTQIAEAINARNQALLANRGQAQSALRDLRLGVINVEANKRNQQALLAAQQLLESSFGGGSGLADAQGGGPTGPRAKMKQVAKRIQNLVQVYVQPNQDAHVKAEAYSKLVKFWKQRNRLRRRQGLNPIPLARLGKVIAQAADIAEDDYGVAQQV